ncbi:MAG: disulfide bond formation protein B [Alphaproteobacteria bacterium]|nr:disulfide bond formation protein B [Alphaproteobacteria bacterium]
MMKQLFIRTMNLWSQPHFTAFYVAAASAALLAVAYTSQYVFGLDPCILCYYQRIPYFVVIALGLAAFAVAPKSEKLALYLIFLCGIGFLIDAGIAGFHVGVEHGAWKGLEACGNAAMPANATPEEMRAFIMSRDIVRCDVPAFTLFGISMAGYNFLIALGLMLDTFALLWWRVKKCPVKS